MILTRRKIALTLLCAGLIVGNFGCGQQDDASTKPPMPPPAPTKAATGADATTTKETK